MTAKNFLLFLTCCISYVVSGQTLRRSGLANPTGTYRTHFNNPKGNKFPQGTIKVKLIKKGKIVISLIMQSGEPLLRSGAMTDTVTFKNHWALFRNCEIDSTCQITFRFTSKGIRVKQSSKFTHGSCDFADGVSADGFYFKESNKVRSL